MSIQGIIEYELFSRDSVLQRDKLIIIKVGYPNMSKL